MKTLQMSVVDQVLKEIGIKNFSKKEEVIIFFIILALNEFQGRIERINGFLHITLYSGIYFDESLKNSQKELFLKEMKRINDEKYRYLSRYEIDTDGEITIKTLHKVEGTFEALEWYYKYLFEGIFKEASKTWRKLMRVYYEE